jgi:hypothetical protein
MKFTVHEKQVKAQLGAAYDLSKYTEGVDYKRQKTGFGSRVMFKAGLFDLSADLNAKTAAKSDLNEPSDVLNDLSADLSANHIALSVVDPSLVEHKQDMAPIIIRPAVLDGSVRAARVVKKHANQRFVETDTLGRVFVGEKGHQIKMNQIINVKDGVLFLAKVATLPIH